MKVLVLISLLLPFLSTSQNEIEWKLEWEINVENCVWNVDSFGNLIMSDGSNLQKYDSLGRQTFSQSNKLWGNVSSIDVANPMKILIFSEDQQLISYVDNTLSKQQDVIELSDHDLSYVTLVATSGQPDKIWVYDQDNSKVLLIARTVLQQQRIENIRGLLGCKNVHQLVEKDNNLYLIDGEEGILKFDLYGTFISKWSIKGIKNLYLENEIAYYVIKNKLHVLELETDKIEQYDLPLEDVLKVKKESNSMYVQTPTKILKYSIQILK